jgi:hypothetical protein
MMAIHCHMHVESWGDQAEYISTAFTGKDTGTERSLTSVQSQRKRADEEFFQ